MKPRVSGRNRILKWKCIPDEDIFLYARSCRKAAETTMRTMKLDGEPFAAFDACAIVFLYRYAVEVHLKALVLGDGGNFLTTKPDPLSVYKTRSLSWLGQFACQIVAAVGWEGEFRCEGIESLADFKVFIDELNDSGPASFGFRISIAPPVPDSDAATLAPAVREFVRRTEALLELLERTADGLAAEWDLRSEGGAPPTIH
jgi:hypothetical protein